MNKFSVLMVLGALVVAPLTAHAADAVASKGRMLYSNSGQRIAPVYRVTSDGSAQLILEGKLVTVPASTITEANGRIETSMNKVQLATMR